jgi:hypothetical protein
MRKLKWRDGKRGSGKDGNDVERWRSRENERRGDRRWKGRYGETAKGEMEERDDKKENVEVERKKEIMVIVDCIFFMRLLCVLGEDMQHRIIFEMLFMNHK